MKLYIGLTLMLVGAAIALYGIGTALSELIGEYQSVLETPLEGPVDQESKVSHAMIRDVIIGGVGIPPFLVGSTMFYVELRKNRASKRRYARSAPGAGGW